MTRPRNPYKLNAQQKETLVRALELAEHRGVAPTKLFFDIRTNRAFYSAPWWRTKKGDLVHVEKRGIHRDSGDRLLTRDRGKLTAAGVEEARKWREVLR